MPSTAITYPRELKRGVLAGRTFATHAEYSRALREIKRDRGVKTLNKKRTHPAPAHPKKVGSATDFEFHAQHGDVKVTVEGSLSGRSLAELLQTLSVA